MVLAVVILGGAAALASVLALAAMVRDRDDTVLRACAAAILFYIAMAAVTFAAGYEAIGVAELIVGACWAAMLGWAVRI